MRRFVGDVVLYAVLVVLFVTSWSVMSRPDVGGDATSVLLAFWALAASAWSAALLVAFERTRHRERFAVRWIAPPLLAVALLGACLADLPVESRFLVSRGALNSAVKRARAGAPEPDRAGWFAVQRLYLRGSGAEIVVGVTPNETTVLLVRDTDSAKVATHWGPVVTCHALDGRWQLCRVSG